MIESNLNKLLHGMLGSVDEHVFLKNLQGKYFVVAIYMLEGKDESRFEQWSSVIKEQMQHSGMDVFLAPYSRRKLSVTFNFDEMQKEQVFEWIAQAMKISPNLANQISCGVGPIVQDLELHVSCEGALDALKHRYLVEEEVLVPLYYDEVQQLPNYDGSIFYEQLSTAIKTNQLEQICDLFTRLSDEMAGTMYRYESVVLVLYRIIPIVAELMMESGAQYEGGSINAQMLANSLFNQRSIFDSLEWLSTMLRGIVSSSRSAQPTELLMDSVKLYIEENYHQEISLELLSQKTFVSSSYISQLFKRTFGIGVSEYVSQIRMNKARELLKDQNLKVEQVAEMVGLSNSTYFITKFKKTFGMTPNQYRINQKARKLNSD